MYAPLHHPITITGVGVSLQVLDEITTGDFLDTLKSQKVKTVRKSVSAQDEETAVPPPVKPEVKVSLTRPSLTPL